MGVVSVSTLSRMVPPDAAEQGWELAHGALGYVQLRRWPVNPARPHTGHEVYSNLGDAIHRWPLPRRLLQAGTCVLISDSVATENGSVAVIMTDSGQLGYVPLSTASDDFYGVSVVRRVS